MPRRKLQTCGVLALTGLWLGAAGLVQGQEASAVGMARISDRGGSIQPAALFHHHQGAAPCPTCEPAGVAAGAYASGYAGVYGDPNCQAYGGHGYGHGHRCGIFYDHYCTHSPDYGFSVPAKQPILRHGVQYNRFWPTAWYGTPGVNPFAGAPLFPMVYQPTDTTQLGYYYQHVPYWQPVPNPLPPRPVPAQWHTTAAPVSATQRYGAHHKASVYPTTVYGLGVYEGVPVTPTVLPGPTMFNGYPVEMGVDPQALPAPLIQPAPGSDSGVIVPSPSEPDLRTGIEGRIRRIGHEASEE